MSEKEELVLQIQQFEYLIAELDPAISIARNSATEASDAALRAKFQAQEIEEQLERVKRQVETVRSVLEDLRQRAQMI